jgi:hypothetical protein
MYQFDDTLPTIAEIPSEGVDVDKMINLSTKAGAPGDPCGVDKLE